MNYNENRLQFVHCDTLFNTAEEAKRYVMGNLETIKRPSLYAEPMVLKYGEASKPNIILAIGSVGDGVTQSMDNRTFFIDFAKAENDIKEIIEAQGENKEIMQKLQSIIDNLIVSCGLDENGKYNKESIADDAILANSNSLYEADKLLSEYIIALEKKHSLNVEESSSIKFELTKDDETGMILSGSVKLADNKTVDKTVLDNQLLSEEDGLFYNVDFSYDNVNGKAIFSVNGNKTEYDLPKETFLVDGKYDSESESLILSLNREAEYNGKTVKDISIDLKDLIGEWGVLPVDAQNSPIILTKSAVTSEDVLHGATLTQDILSADVRIASNEQVPDNILKKDSTGRYLYVEGKAKNISYWDKNGNKITVDEALNNVKCNVSTHVGNIIVEKTDGLFATVSLDYDVASNTLKFNDGVNSVKSIKLNSAEFIDTVYYDTATETIKIKFKLADGTLSTVQIPVGDIIEEWDVDNTGTTVTLKKVRNDGRGQDMLSANVNVANSSDDNILKVKGNALYVKGTADNIRYKETTVASELDSIKNGLSNEIESRKNADNALTASLTQEVNDRITGDTEVKNLVKAEENRAISEETRIEHLVNDNAASVAENKEKISTIETTVDSFDNRIQTVEEGFAVVKEDVEKAVEEANAMADKVQENADAIAAETSRAKLAEQNNQSAINQEVQRATAAEEAIASSVETEKERAITAESELRVSVNANTNGISQVSNKLNSEIERAIAKEQELTSADASLSEKLSTEITRATASEEKIASDLVNEITRSQSTDEQIISKVDINSSNIVSETNRATSKEAEIERNVETLNGALTNEITRARDAENALSTRVKTNADAITILNGSVETAGSVREIVSHVQEDVEAKINNEITRATAAENGLQSQIDNLKSDVNAGNEQTLADAKAYTDAEVAKHKVDTDNAIENAKAEAISTASEDASNKSSQTLVDAKAYTNEQASLVTERLNVSISNAKAEAIEAASADATTKSDVALTSAKAYTDAETVRATAAENGLQSQIDDLVSKDSELVVELDKKIENVEVRKNSENDLQYTLYVDGVPAGDINIPQDQFLQDVTYNSVSKELTFLFITSEGVKTQVVNVSDLIDVYVAGNGLSLDDNTFSVKRDSASESYLEVSVDGIKVVGIDAALATKANVGDSYTKSESDDKYLTEHQDISNLATKEYVDVVKTDLNELSVKVYENSDNITIINGNESTDGSIAKALKDSKTYADTQVSAETVRATAVENGLQGAINVINGNESTDGSIAKALKDAKTYADTQVSAEKSRAEVAEKANADAIAIINGNESTDGSIAKALKDAKTYADTQVQNEATLRANVDNELDAKIATKANINDVYTKAEIDAKNFVNQNDINGFATIEQVNAVDEKVNANITAIAEKANKADVYTKLESDDKFLTKVDAKETYATIAKLDETNVKVEQNKADISTLNNTVENMKFDTVNTDTISLAMNSSTSGKTLSGNVKVAQVEGNIIKVNGSGIYANVSLVYNKATNTITFNDGNGAKEYELSMHSLVTDGYYDAETRKIVLVIETAEGTKHAYIPVADLVNDFKVENSDNNPIKLYKNVGSDGVNVLTASVAISTSPDNLVLNNNGTLFVSKEAKNHTAIIKGETVSVQKALSDLDDGITTVNGDITNIQTELTNITNDIDSLESKVNQNSLDIATTKGQVETLSAQVSAMQEKVGLLEQSVNEYNAEIEKLKQVVGEPVEGELPIRERLDKIEEIVNSLIDFGQYQNTF